MDGTAQYANIDGSCATAPLKGCLQRKQCGKILTISRDLGSATVYLLCVEKEAQS